MEGLSPSQGSGAHVASEPIAKLSKSLGFPEAKPTTITEEKYTSAKDLFDSCIKTLTQVSEGSLQRMDESQQKKLGYYLCHALEMAGEAVTEEREKAIAAGISAISGIGHQALGSPKNPEALTKSQLGFVAQPQIREKVDLSAVTADYAALSIEDRKGLIAALKDLLIPASGPDTKLRVENGVLVVKQRKEGESGMSEASKEAANFVLTTLSRLNGGLAEDGQELVQKEQEYKNLQASMAAVSNQGWSWMQKLMPILEKAGLIEPLNENINDKLSKIKGLKEAASQAAKPKEPLVPKDYIARIEQDPEYVVNTYRLDLHEDGFSSDTLKVKGGATQKLFDMFVEQYAAADKGKQEAMYNFLDHWLSTPMNYIGELSEGVIGKVEQFISLLPEEKRAAIQEKFEKAKAAPISVEIPATAEQPVDISAKIQKIKSGEQEGRAEFMRQLTRDLKEISALYFSNIATSEIVGNNPQLTAKAGLADLNTGLYEVLTAHIDKNDEKANAELLSFLIDMERECRSTSDGGLPPDMTLSAALISVIYHNDLAKAREMRSDLPKNFTAMKSQGEADPYEELTKSMSHHVPFYNRSQGKITDAQERIKNMPNLKDRYNRTISSELKTASGLQESIRTLSEKKFYANPLQTNIRALVEEGATKRREAEKSGTL